VFLSVCHKYSTGNACFVPVCSSLFALMLFGCSYHFLIYTVSFLVQCPLACCLLGCCWECMKLSEHSKAGRRWPHCEVCQSLLVSNWHSVFFICLCLSLFLSFFLPFSLSSFLSVFLPSYLPFFLSLLCSSSAIGVHTHASLCLPQCYTK